MQALKAFGCFDSGALRSVREGIEDLNYCDVCRESCYWTCQPRQGKPPSILAEHERHAVHYKTNSQHGPTPSSQNSSRSTIHTEFLVGCFDSGNVLSP